MGGKGAATTPADGLCLDISTLHLDAVTLPGGATVVSGLGGTEITLQGRGFDSQTCSHNHVSLGGEACVVTGCSRSAVLAICAAANTGEVDYVAAATAEDDEPATKQEVRVRVENDVGDTVGEASLDALVVSTGGATAPYCVITQEDTVVGSRATLDLLCSKAAVDVGVAALHLTDLTELQTAQQPGSSQDGASPSGPTGNARRLRVLDGGRRLAQTSPDAEEERETSDMAPEAFVCKVRRASHQQSVSTSCLFPSHTSVHGCRAK